VTDIAPLLPIALEVPDLSVPPGCRDHYPIPVYFTLSPEKQLQVKDELIGKAVLNAKSKAENALAPLNHKIIGVKAVTLSEFGMPPPMPMFRADFAMAEAAMAPTPVFSSEQDVRTTASVIFLIGSN